MMATDIDGLSLMRVYRSSHSINATFIGAIVILAFVSLAPLSVLAQTIGPPTQILPIRHNVVPDYSEPGGDRFGKALATLGDKIVVAAPNARWKPIGMPEARQSGIVHVHDSAGTLLKLLVNPATPPPGMEAYKPNRLGISVAMVSQNIVAVGAEKRETRMGPSIGTVFLYDLTNCGHPDITALCEMSVEVENPNIFPAQEFGRAIAAGNNRILVGTSNSGEPGVAYLFAIERVGPQLQSTLLHTFRSPNPSPDDLFGLSVALEGNYVIIGAPKYGDPTQPGTEESGAVLIYDIEACPPAADLPCVPTTTITKPGANTGDNFGWSLAVDSGRILVGARLDEPFTQLCSQDGCEYIDSAGNSGAAFLFEMNGTLLRNFVDPVPNFLHNFGWSVVLSGNRAFIAAIDSEVYVYNIDQCPASVPPGPGEPAEAWLNNRCAPAFSIPIPEQGDGGFCCQYTLAKVDNTLVVGAYFDDTLSKNVGAMYLFTPTTGSNSAPALDPIGDHTITACNAFSITAAATDPDIPQQSLTFSAPGAPPSASMDPTTGQFTWEPSPQEAGTTVTFDIVVSDTDLTDRETITLTIEECDGDGDGLPDRWETEGIDWNNDTRIDLDLPALGADPNRKDIFVQVDYMSGYGLADMAQFAVTQVFRLSGVNNPGTMDGINLHIQIDESIPHEPLVSLPRAFELKEDYRGTFADRSDPNSVNILAAKKLVYHNVLMVNKFDGDEYMSEGLFEEGQFTPLIQYDYSHYTGLGEPFGNDFIVAVGNLASNNWRYQAAVFMHELGHNLALDHGGPIPPDRVNMTIDQLDEDNCKPNYLSIMNYTFMFPDIYPLRPLDYSRSRLATLNEAALDERVGVETPPPGNPVWKMSVFGVGPPLENKFIDLLDLDYAVNWNNSDGGIDEDPVRANINALDIGGERCISTAVTALEGYDDWENLRFDFRHSEYYDIGSKSVVSIGSKSVPLGTSPVVPLPVELTRQELEYRISVSAAGRIRPTDLTATTQSAESIKLRWEKGDLDGALISGYRIERKTATGNDWITVVVDSGSQERQYKDEGLAPDTTYIYMVSTLTVGGLISIPSDPASATTNKAFQLFIIVLVAAVVIALLIFVGVVVMKTRARS